MMIDTYSPRFDDFNGDPMVTWRENGSTHISVNLYTQYLRFKNPLNVKDQPPASFWLSGGPAIVRALTRCGAHALIAAVIPKAAGDRVTYRWFSSINDSREWFRICPVVCESGGLRGQPARVVVTLPTEEDVFFTFHWRHLEEWYKKDPTAPAESEVDGQEPS